MRVRVFRLRVFYLYQIYNWSSTSIEISQWSFHRALTKAGNSMSLFRKKYSQKIVNEILFQRKRFRFTRKYTLNQFYLFIKIVKEIDKGGELLFDWDQCNNLQKLYAFNISAISHFSFPRKLLKSIRRSVRCFEETAARQKLICKVTFCIKWTFALNTKSWFCYTTVTLLIIRS